MSGLEVVNYRDGNTALTGLLARPAGKPRAAVAVYPTIMNSTPAVIDKAEALAAAGYLALVCDFYGSQPADFVEARELAGALRSSQQAYRGRLHAGLAALAAQNHAQSLPLIAIGFCMGGQAALELAREGTDIAVAASFHGLLETTGPAEPGTIKARILVCHGDADVIVPRSQVMAFWEEMDAAGANWHFHSYSGVRHGFTNPYPSPGNSAVQFDASADRQSWAAMLGLFDEVLG